MKAFVMEEGLHKYTQCTCTNDSTLQDGWRYSKKLLYINNACINLTTYSHF